MEHGFWRSRWQEGAIGFHEGRPNALLLEHARVLAKAKRVLVPLCGKAEDLAWLVAQGHEVVGVELVDSAVQAFFAEHQVTPEVLPLGTHTQYRANGITILSGDFFTTTPKLVGAIDGLYDRAALIALPEPMRKDYVRHLRSLLPAGAPGLVITVEYEQTLMNGPPFSVPEAELRTHYEGRPVERLADVAGVGPRFEKIGAREKCFSVRF
jgi:thiopurine S-methyltransferase